MHDHRTLSTGLGAALAALVLAVLISAAPAAAQFTQYQAASAFEDDVESIDQILETAMADARWRWGPFLVDPWIGVRELSYDDNVGNRAREPILEDYLIKVGAGVRGYLPVKEDLVFTAHVLPEYVWWRELSDRRQLNGRYGAGLFGHAGPVGLQLSAQRLEDTRYFSREFEDRVDVTEDHLRGGVEVDVGRGLAVFGRGNFDRYRFAEADPGVDPAVGVLDRDETYGRAGLRFKPRDNLTLAAGFELSRAEFQGGDPRRDNSGTAPVVELGYEGPRLELAADVAWRSLDAEGGGSDFPGFDGATGSFRTAWRLFGAFQIELLGARNLVYSFDEDFAFFRDQFLAYGVVVSFGDRVGLRVRYEDGRDDFFAFDPTQVFQRIDDFSGVSGEIQVDLGVATLVVSAADIEYDSNLPVFDRTVTTVSTGLVFGRRNQSPWG